MAHEITGIIGEHHWDGIGYTTVIEPLGGDPGQALRFVFKVWRISGWLMDDEKTRLYGEDNEPGFQRLSPEIIGQIGWDGCSHVVFKGEAGEDDGYFHLCGYNAWASLASLLQRLFALAAAVFPECNEQVQLA